MFCFLARWAQEDTGPTLVDAAVNELNRSFPGIGDPDTFTYTFSAPTNDSSLGCPLIEGFELPQSVVPYRITLVYGTTQYVYHASGDGAILFPCDPKLPIGGPIGAPGTQPFTPSSPVEAAIDVFVESYPDRGFPDRFEFTYSPALTERFLGCPLVGGGTLSRGASSYEVTLFDDGQRFVYYVAADGSIITPC